MLGPNSLLSSPGAKVSFAWFPVHLLSFQKAPKLHDSGPDGDLDVFNRSQPGAGLCHEMRWLSTRVNSRSRHREPALSPAAIRMADLAEISIGSSNWIWRPVFRLIVAGSRTRGNSVQPKIIAWAPFSAN